MPSKAGGEALPLDFRTAETLGRALKGVWGVSPPENRARRPGWPEVRLRGQTRSIFAGRTAIPHIIAVWREVLQILSVHDRRKFCAFLLQRSRISKKTAVGNLFTIFVHRNRLWFARIRNTLWPFLRLFLSPSFAKIRCNSGGALGIGL